MTDVKHAERPAAKLQAPPPPETSATAVLSPEPTAPAFAPMTTAPNDRVIMVTKGDGHFVQARWRKTRKWDSNRGAWEATGFWSGWPGTAKLEWEPIGWKPT